MDVTRAISARSLSRLRNAALKAGNMAAASAIRDSQKLRKDGFHASAKAVLASYGLAVESNTMHSTFPQESRLLARHYRVCHNLKGESRKVSRDHLMVERRAEFDKPRQ